MNLGNYAFRISWHLMRATNKRAIKQVWQVKTRGVKDNCLLLVLTDESDLEKATLIY